MTDQVPTVAFPLAGRLIVLGLLLALVLGLLLAGCSPMTRYRVLTFFFEDVPPPEGVAEKPPTQQQQKVPGPWGIQIAPEDEELPPELRPPPETPERVEAAVVVFHEPYRRRRCGECHRAEASYEVGADESEICARCHEEHLEVRPDDSVHAPAAMGRCSLCHEPHKAQHEELLDAPQPDLCWRCHDAESTLEAPYHDRTEERDCSYCHDPHLAGNPGLLVDSRSYRRSGPELLPAPSGHAAWPGALCSSCHLPEQSNVPVEDVDARCRTCHPPETLAPADDGLHPPVQMGLCTVCHAAHRSPRAHLVKPLAEKLCYGCHSAESIQSEGHPPVKRADCLICHRGHHSAREHLLRNGIPSH